MSDRWKVVKSQADIDDLLKMERVLVGVGARWCDQSQSFKRDLERNAVDSDVVIAWVDPLEVPGVSKSLGVRCTPALLNIERGVVQERHMGRPNGHQIKRMLSPDRGKELQDYALSSYLFS